MTDRQLNNRITKLQGIEAQMKELEAQAEAIRAELTRAQIVSRQKTLCRIRQAAVREIGAKEGRKSVLRNAQLVL